MAARDDRLVVTASYYDLLGVAPDADPVEVRQAYLALARLHHPDREGGDPARMRAINDAWQTLRDPTLRRVYDERLAAARGVYRTVDDWAAPQQPGPEWDQAFPDLEDDRPIGPTPSGWFALIPVGLFAAFLGVGVLGLLLQLAFLTGAALVLFAFSCLSFLAAPILSLYFSRRAASRPQAPAGHAPESDTGDGTG